MGHYASELGLLFGPQVKCDGCGEMTDVTSDLEMFENSFGTYKLCHECKKIAEKLIIKLVRQEVKKKRTQKEQQ